MRSDQIGQGCWRKSSSGNRSLSLDSMVPLTNRKGGLIIQQVTFAKASLQIVRLVRFSETFVPDHP